MTASLLPRRATNRPDQFERAALASDDGGYGGVGTFADGLVKGNALSFQNMISTMNVNQGSRDVQVHQINSLVQITKDSVAATDTFIQKLHRFHVVRAICPLITRFFAFQPLPPQLSFNVL